jgi:hypothetical protein
MYGYCVVVLSPRKLEKCVFEDVDFLGPAAGNTPDF